MLGSLIKHEFRATARRMLPTLGVLALLAALANLSIRLLDAEFGGLLLKILMALFIAAFFIGIIVAWIIALVLMISRFYRNLLKDEGYLMFTLPTDTHALIWSKLIVSTVWFLATALLIALCFMLTMFNIAGLSGEDLSGLMPALREGLSFLYAMGVTKSSLILSLAQLILASVVSCLVTCLHFYAAMGLGQLSATKKGMWSVLAFIGISLFFQILGSAVLSGFAGSRHFEVVISSFEELAQSAPGLVKAFNTGLGGAWLIQLLQGAILYAVTALTLNKKLNLA